MICRSFASRHLERSLPLGVHPVAADRGIPFPISGGKHKYILDQNSVRREVCRWHANHVESFPVMTPKENPSW